MKDERDPVLLALFADSQQELAPEAFEAQVMSNVDKQTSKAIIAWVGIGLLLIPFIWWVSAPLQDFVDLLTPLLPESLIDLDNELLAQFLAPINSVSALIALGFFGLLILYRKIFS